MPHDNVTEQTDIESHPISERQLDTVLAQLAGAAADPVHKRLIAVYMGGDRLAAMIEEFSKVLREVARGEA